jgi:hypothetical protein
MERDSMEQDNFSYASTAGFGASSSQLRVYVFCEEALRRAEMAEDLRNAEMNGPALTVIGLAPRQAAQVNILEELAL